MKIEFGEQLSKHGSSKSHGSLYASDKVFGWTSLSCLKQLKNFLRSILSLEKLNALTLLCIESELMNKILYDDIIVVYGFKISQKSIVKHSQLNWFHFHHTRLLSDNLIGILFVLLLICKPNKKANLTQPYMLTMIELSLAQKTIS